MTRFRVLALLFLVSASGCFAVRVNTSAPHAQSHSTLEWHFFWGLTPARVSTGDCPSGIAEVRIDLPWWSVGCLGPLTLGIVYATKVDWKCVEPTPTPAPTPGAR